MKTKLILAGAVAAMALTAPAFANEEDMKAKFDMHDTNDDGSLSKAEWDATSAEMWNQADANKDGKVTFEEKKALHDKHKED